MNDGNLTKEPAPAQSGLTPDAAFKGEDYVRWAYRLLLGREPESLAAIENNEFKNNRQKLVEFFLESAEFKSKYKDLSSDRNSNPYLSWAEDAAAFIYLPKTGGTTLHNMLSDCFPLDRVFPVGSHSLYNFSAAELSKYVFFSGHADYFSFSFIPRKLVRRISVFREPVPGLSHGIDSRDRILSAGISTETSRIDWPRSWGLRNSSNIPKIYRQPA